MYASYLENVTFIGCDFIGRNEIRNCRFINVKFMNCFIEANMFHNCRFDERTGIDTLVETSRYTDRPKNFKPVDYAEIYRGIKESYRAGSVISKSREYYFLERHANTRYLIDGMFEKIGNYFLEYVVGYGIKPLRVLVSMILTFIVCTEIFIYKLGFTNGLLLSTGAYFTNGASSDLLRSIGTFYQIVFIIESFLGIVFTALFVTVMANLWLSEK
jgi:hypothetical protein